MAGEKLTALAVERAHRRGAPVTLNDGGGLYFRKQTTQGATWMFRYRFAGRPRWMALGNYPDMSLAEARKAARAQRVKLDQQRDPLDERRAARAHEAARGSFVELAEDWFAAEIEGHVEHPQIPRRHLDKYLLPSLRHLKADEVSTADITRIVDKIKKAKPTVANDLLRFARRIFDFGVRRHRLKMNPAGGLVPRRDGGGTEESRERSLSREELVALLKKARESTSFGLANLLLLKLLLALLVRKRQLIAAMWEEFDLDGQSELGPVWRLPASRGKRIKTAVDIPLAPPVVEWLRTVKVLAGDSPYVFPRRRQHRRARYPHMGIDTLNAALDELEHGLQHFTVHDMRRTARTHLAALGVRPEVAEKSLSHKLKGIVGVYDRHDYFNERRAALESWAAVLVECERGEAVAPVNGRKAGRSDHT